MDHDDTMDYWQQIRPNWLVESQLMTKYSKAAALFLQLQGEQQHMENDFAPYRGVAYDPKTGEVKHREDCLMGKGDANARDRFLRSIPAEVEVDDLKIVVRPF